MRTLATLPQDGFYGDKEFIDFIKAMNDDIIEVLSSIIGSSTAFIKGGVISVSGGDVNITSGVILKDNKLYKFTGGTFAGTTATLKILFKEELASGYPQSYFDGDPTPKDIYLERSAIIEASGSIVLNTVLNLKDLEWLKNKADLVDGKAGKNAFSALTPTLGAGFSVFASSLNARDNEDGTISLAVNLINSGAKTKGAVIYSALPGNQMINEPFPVSLNDGSTDTIGWVWMQPNGQLQVFSGFGGTITTVYISLRYKKA